LLGIFFLKEEMARQGLSVADLAERCQLGFRSMQNEMRMGISSQRLRKRIEHELSLRSVWSSSAEITFRQRTSDLFGLDPGIASLEEIKALCQRLQIAAPSVRQREQYLALLAAWLAAHPNYQPDQSTKKQ
jgi:hypothetical protein